MECDDFSLTDEDMAARPPSRQVQRAKRWAGALLRAAGLEWGDAAHGGLTLAALLAVSAQEDPPETWTLPVFGLLASQLCLMGAWAAWSAESWLARANRLAWRFAWFYWLILAVESLESRRHTAMLSSLALTLGQFVAAAWLPAWGLRWFRWRLVCQGHERAGQSEGPAPQRRRYQFALADVGRWMTLLCVLLATMGLFQNELAGFDGFGYVILIALALHACLPTGLVSTMLLWVGLAPRWTIARKLIAGLLAVVWIAASCVTLSYYLEGTTRGEEGTWAWLFAQPAIAVGLGTALVLRWYGWRLEREVRKRTGPPSADSDDR